MKGSVLLTGGAGVIGAFTCKELLRSGFHPVIYDLSFDDSLLSNVKEDITYICGNILDLRHLFQTIQEHQIEMVVHLAALIHPACERDPYNGFEVNSFGSLNVFEASRLGGCKKVVFTSSKGAFAPAFGPYAPPECRAVDETYPKDPHDVYGASKLTVEYIAANFHRIYGLETIGLRFSTVYGPGRLARHGKVAITSRLIESAWANQPFHHSVGGDQPDDFLYVKDAARAVFLAVEDSSTESGMYNIGTGRLNCLKDMCSILKRKYPTSQVSVGDGMDYLGTGRPKFFKMNYDKAEKHLRYTPTYNLEQGIEDYINYLELIKT